MSVLMAGGGWWWWCGCGGVGRVVEHHRVQHGGVVVETWCMYCVYKAKVFPKQNYRRFDEGQFTKVGCKTNMPKQCIIGKYLGRTALSMIGRAGGWLEWSGAVKGRAGSGVGVWGGRARGRGVTTVPF